jgi:hypothetical protein
MDLDLVLVWNLVRMTAKPFSISTVLQGRTEVVIEHNSQPVAVVHPAQPVQRTLSECLDLLSEDSKATIDADFASDVEAAVESHREALGSSAWE